MFQKVRTYHTYSRPLMTSAPELNTMCYDNIK